MKTVQIDSTNHFAGDDGNTTHYGGFISVNGEKFDDEGNDDRSGQNICFSMAKSVLENLGLESDEDSIEEVTCVLQEAGVDIHPAVFEVTGEDLRRLECKKI